MRTAYSLFGGRIFVGLLTSMSTIAPAQTTSQSTTTIYVSDKGNDLADGLSIAYSVRTLDHALAMSRIAKRPVRILLSGRFVLPAPLQLTKSDRGLYLKGDGNGIKAQIVAGHGAKTGIMVVGSDGAIIEGLAFSNFSDDALVVVNATDVSVRGNDMYNTMSSASSHGAIHFFGKVRGGEVDRNLVKGADYAGIIVDTNLDSDVSGMKITRNITENVCRKVADCGAIYINDRGQRSENIRITGNTVRNFGTELTKGRAVYLDDFASKVLVSGNRIDGPGSYAFQIHGGHGNMITGNKIDMDAISYPLLYQPETVLSWGQMKNNSIEGNLFVNARGASILSGISIKLTPIESLPKTSNNKLCVNVHCLKVDG